MKNPNTSKSKIKVSTKAEFCWSIGGSIKQLREIYHLSLEDAAKLLSFPADDLHEIEWGSLKFSKVTYLLVWIHLMMNTILRSEPEEVASQTA